MTTSNESRLNVVPAGGRSLMPSPSQQSIQLDDSVSHALSQANGVSQEIIDSATQAIGNGAGELTFNDTVTYIVEPDGTQKVVFQRNVHLAKD